MPFTKTTTNDIAIAEIISLTIASILAFFIFEPLTAIFIFFALYYLKPAH